MAPPATAGRGVEALGFFVCSWSWGQVGRTGQLGEGRAGPGPWGAQRRSRAVRLPWLPQGTGCSEPIPPCTLGLGGVWGHLPRPPPLRAPPLALGPRLRHGRCVGRKGLEKTISGLRTVPPRWNPARLGRLLQGCGQAWRLSPTALPARPASGEARPTALPGVCPRPGRGASRCVCRRVGGWNSHAALNTPGGARGSQGVGAAEGAEQRRRPSPGRFSSWGRSGRADAPSAEVGGAEKHLSPVGTQEGLRVTRGFAQRLQPLSDLRDNGGFTSTRPWTLLPGLEFRHRQALEVAEPSAGSGARGPDSAIEARPAA